MQVNPALMCAVKSKPNNNACDLGPRDSYKKDS